jgi:hypothetical protein
LILNRPVAPADLDPHFQVRWLRISRIALKTALIGLAVFSLTKTSLNYVTSYGSKAPKPLFYGIYDVAEYTMNGKPVPPLMIDRERWKRVTFQNGPRMTITAMDNSVRNYAIRTDATRKTITLSTEGDIFTYNQPDADHVVLQQTLGGNSLLVRMKKFDEQRFLLVNRGFHWINEFPFNR